MLQLILKGIIIIIIIIVIKDEGEIQQLIQMYKPFSRMTMPIILAKDISKNGRNNSISINTNIP